MRKDALIFAVALTLGFGGVAGCGKLRELRELRDSMGHPAVPAGYGAGIVDVDDPPDDRPPVVERDTGVVVGGDAGGGDTGGFFPVEDTDAMGPSFEEPPFIFEAWPAFGSTAGGTLVTVDGDRFTPDAEVLLGGVRIGRVDFVDRYEILFWTEAMPAGTVDLKITTPAGTAMAEGAFTFVDDLRIFGVEPARGAIAGGAPVVVSGTGFTPQTRVSFGDREARVDRFVSAEEMEVIAPPGPGG